MASSIDFRYAPGHAAIVVVDMQNDYCDPRGSLARLGCDVSDVRTMARRLERLIETGRAAGVPPVFVRTTHGPNDDSHAWLNRYGHTEGDEPQGVICREDDPWGTDWYGVRPQPGDPVITKHRYSAFQGTSLSSTLRTRGIQSLLFTGVSTEICVESSLRDGLFEDFYVSLVEDCTSSYVSEAFRASVDVVRRNFGTVVSSGDLIDAWGMAR